MLNLIQQKPVQLNYQARNNTKYQPAFGVMLHVQEGSQAANQLMKLGKKAEEFKSHGVATLETYLTQFIEAIIGGNKDPKNHEGIFSGNAFIRGLKLFRKNDPPNREVKVEDICRSDLDLGILKPVLEVFDPETSKPINEEQVIFEPYTELIARIQDRLHKNRQVKADGQTLRDKIASVIKPYKPA